MIAYHYQGFGVAKADYVLDDASLNVTLPGAQLGKRLVEGRVPLAAVTGFFVEQPIRFAGVKGRAAGGLASAAKANGGKLVVAWREGGRTRRRTYHMVNVSDPDFGTLIAELARRRPDADLRRLPVIAARARIGMWSDQKRTLVAMAVLIAVLVTGMAVFSLVR
jgi:hypothetical protein